MRKFIPRAWFFLLISAFTVFLTATAYLSLRATSSKRTITDEHLKISKKEIAQNSQSDTSEVLGRSTSPQIYIHGGGDYSSGGMIALASTDEPAVQIGGYSIAGMTDVSVYKADIDSLLDYLTHNKEWKQTKTQDIGKFQFVTKVSKIIQSNTYEGSKVALPLEETGIWYLIVENGSTKTEAFVIRSNIGVLVKEGDDEFIFWGQNFKTKRSISDGNVRVLSMLDGKTELSTVSFNADGIAKAPINQQADIALVSQNEDYAVIPINLQYINTGYNYSRFETKPKTTRYFIFTDRPLYKPGDTVYFKAVLRDDDDARYSVPVGSEANVKIYNGYYYSGSDEKPLFERSVSISSEGTINGEYHIPEDAKVGYYSLDVSVPGESTSPRYWYSESGSSTVSFSVEYFRKPEFSIDIETPVREFIAGENFSFNVTGTYFSGQPLIGQEVEYTVYSGDYYEYQYLTDRDVLSGNMDDSYRYGTWYGRGKVTSGTATLDEKGRAQISVDTKLTGKEGRSQVFTVETTLSDGSQSPSFARRNVLVFSGEWGIYRKNYSYSSQANKEYVLPLTLVSNRDTLKVSGVNLKANIHREDWISYPSAESKYPSYKKEEEDLPEVNVKTDKEGNAEIKFTPQKTGHYTITVEGQDTKGNLVSKQFYAYISKRDYPYYSEYGQSDLTISKDKEKYNPTESAVLSIYSAFPNRDVFLTIERGRVDRYQVLHMDGKNMDLELKFAESDKPNIYASISSFGNSSLDSNMVNVPVSAKGKKLNVQVTPNSTTFGPGETVTVNVSVTDSAGNPVSADVALWTVDKAIFELSDDKLGDIFSTYWSERGNSTQSGQSLEGISVYNAEMGGGCFAEGTKILLDEGKTQNIENIRAGDELVTFDGDGGKKVKAKVTGVHKTEEAGVLIINGYLKVTANHILRVNNLWKDAGSIRVGDFLAGKDGDVVVTSIEWQAGKFNVYNLEVDKYHTFIAGGVWVHNQKGDTRNAFKDTAYWNPSIKTDESGHAQVSFKVPDNLTTWTLAAVAETRDTRVGQTTNEIVVTKDVIVRPIIPNILRQGDTIVLSALVQNFTERDSDFDISLKFDSGEVSEPNKKDIKIGSKEMSQIYWDVIPKTENEKARLTFSAKSKISDKMSDSVALEIPVIPFGYVEKRAQSGEGTIEYSVDLADDTAIEKSSLTLSLSPTIIGSLPSAMRYLVDYPYGCVEQTTSRFVPAVIAKTNGGLFENALEGKDVDDMVKKGVSRLVELQQPDGGWGWWYSGKSNSFISAYVIEYLLKARESGIPVDEGMLQRAKNFTEQISTEYNTREDLVAKAYAFSLFNPNSSTSRVTDFDNLSPDYLSLVVMTNYLNGVKDADRNGLNKLISMAHEQGDGVFWDRGDKLNFGSIDASTGLAIRAILLSEGDTDIAEKGAKYLMRSRKYDYWSNSFATSQVIRAITELVKTGDESTPSYKYTVRIDGKVLKEGSVSVSNRTIKDIQIPAESVLKKGSEVSVEKLGDGRIYSTLFVKEFHTDQNSTAINRGFSLKRDYVNEKGSEYTIGVGDTVEVNITVSGLGSNENYGVIADELPSGLVPVNESFKNEQYGKSNNYYGSWDVSDRDITRNGIVLSLYQIAPGQRTYSYRARVVNEGTFLIPPTTASLMYAPEINGMSASQTITVAKQSRIIPGAAIKKTFSRGVTKLASGKSIGQGIGIIIFIGAILTLFVMRKRFKLSKTIHEKLGNLFKRKRKDPPDIKTHIYNDPKPL